MRGGCFAIWRFAICHFTGAPGPWISCLSRSSHWASSGRGGSLKRTLTRSPGRTSAAMTVGLAGPDADVELRALVTRPLSSLFSVSNEPRR